MQKKKEKEEPNREAFITGRVIINRIPQEKQELLLKVVIINKSTRFFNFILFRFNFTDVTISYICKRDVFY